MGTRELVEKEVASQVQHDRLWNVLVWDDPINLMDYVVWVFQKVFGHSLPLANKLMAEVHEQGKALVATEEREKAEMHVSKLHQYGLQATLQKQE
jgi:ATP-dependent Clp protease adaptor protein ClpS